MQFESELQLYIIPSKTMYIYKLLAVALHTISHFD